MATLKVTAIPSRVLYQALRDAELVPENCGNIIIEIPVGGAVKIHCSTFPDERIVEVIAAFASAARIEETKNETDVPEVNVEEVTTQDSKEHRYFGTPLLRDAEGRRMKLTLAAPLTASQARRMHPKSFLSVDEYMEFIWKLMHARCQEGNECFVIPRASEELTNIAAAKIRSAGFHVTLWDKCNPLGAFMRVDWSNEGDRTVGESVGIAEVTNETYAG